MHRAAEEGILVWADYGRIRLSVHLFTTKADVETALARLPALLL
jgi:selenocysteine lyase/cysteine desulfurase